MARADSENHLLPQNIYNMGVSVLRILFISHNPYVWLNVHMCCCCSCWQPLTLLTTTEPSCGMKQRQLPKSSRSAGCLAQAPGGSWKAPGGRTRYSGTCTGRAGSGKRPQPDPAQGQPGFWFVHVAAGFSSCLAQLQEQEVYNQFWMSKMALGASDRTQGNEA